ncbi:hypothetical protein K2X85_16620 [bacterium]|nr:hypothetical protein [bacterium]
MNNSINELLNFVNGVDNSLAVQRFIDSLGHANVYQVAIELFAWLKRHRRFRHEKPLELNFQHAWCKSLATLLNDWASLGELFEIRNDKCNFKDTVTSDERNRIRDLVEEQHRPVLRTSKTV